MPQVIQITATWESIHFIEVDDNFPFPEAGGEINLEAAQQLTPTSAQLVSAVIAD